MDYEFRQREKQGINIAIATFALLAILTLDVAVSFAGSANEFFEQGVMKMKSGNFVQAITDFNNAISIKPDLVVYDLLCKF